MIQHLRSNAIAYLALFIALGGTAFAASKVTSGDIKDNTIKGKDIGGGQVAGSDLRDESATGDDVADGSLDGSDIQDGGLTGADLADKSVGGAKIDPATKVPNADMLDGHGSTRYGVGLQMGAATGIGPGVNIVRFPSGVTVPADNGLMAISPEVLELRDFTAFAEGLSGSEQIAVSLEGGSLVTPCVLTNANPVCHNASNEQSEVVGQALWGIRFTASGNDGGEVVTFSYRAVR